MTVDFALNQFVFCSAPPADDRSPVQRVMAPDRDQWVGATCICQPRQMNRLRNEDVSLMILEYNHLTAVAT